MSLLFWGFVRFWRKFFRLCISSAVIFWLSVNMWIFGSSGSPVSVFSGLLNLMKRMSSSGSKAISITLFGSGTSRFFSMMFLMWLMIFFRLSFRISWTAIF